MATFAEHAQDVADILGIRGVGNTLSDEDRELIQSVALSVFDEISADVYSVADVEDIPNEAREPLAHMVAVDAASRFGITAQDLASKGVTRAGAEWRLRRVMARTRTRKFLAVDPALLRLR